MPKFLSILNVLMRIVLNVTKKFVKNVDLVYTHKTQNVFLLVMVVTIKNQVSVNLVKNTVVLVSNCLFAKSVLFHMYYTIPVVMQHAQSITNQRMVLASN